MLISNRTIAFLLMRVALGVNMFGHGFFRIMTGVSAFANGVGSAIGKGPLPHGPTLAFAYCIPWIEVVVGVMLIIGLFTHSALIAGSAFMIALTIGTTSVQNWSRAGTQLEYSVVFFGLLWLVEANSLSIDGLRIRRNV